MITMVKIMVDGNTMRKARRVKAWFNIKNMDNAIESGTYENLNPQSEKYSITIKNHIQHHY